MADVNKLGMGVLLSLMRGNAESVELHHQAMNKRIKKIWMGEDDRLYLHFEDNTGIYFWDDGQSCCEHRYMMTDDNLTDFTGAVFIEAELREGPSLEESWGEHEQQFLLIKTDRGVITCVTHNEHNGYYGGFAIRIGEFDPDDQQ